MDVPYGLNRLKDPLQPHCDDEPFPPDQVVEAVCQLQHNNQNAKMFIILFGEHSIIGDYTKAIKADDDSVDISFGSMTIRYNQQLGEPSHHPPRRLSSTSPPSFLPSSVLLPNHLFLSSLATILSTMLSSLFMP